MAAGVESLTLFISRLALMARATAYSAAWPPCESATATATITTTISTPRDLQVWKPNASNLQTGGSGSGPSQRNRIIQPRVARDEVPSYPGYRWKGVPQPCKGNSKDTLTTHMLPKQSQNHRRLSGSHPPSSIP